MKPLYLTVALAAVVLLSACGQKAETSTKEQPAATNAAAEMGNLSMPAEAKMAKSTGTVTAIDKAAGKVTIDHAPIPEVSWPAMTMTFDAKPALLENVTIGDKVAFDVTITGNSSEVTAIARQ